MDLGLQGKRAAVMAASEGLGRAAAEALAAEGARVAICARRPAELEQAAREITKATGSDVIPIVADVADARQLGAFIDGAARQLGGLDVLVTNKGGPPAGRLEDLNDEAWLDAFNLIVMSYVRAVRVALPHLRRAGGGSVVAIESITVKQALPELVLSNALRPAVAAISKTLASQLGPEKVRFNVVLPGSMATERIHDLTRHEAQRAGVPYEARLQQRVGEIPLGRLGEPAELARVIAFLASPAAAYVTGSVLQVDGGAVRSVL